MTNHLNSISPDLREEIHHHAQGSIGLGLLRQTTPARIGLILTASLADEGWRWVRAHYDAEVREAALGVVAAAKAGGRLPTLIWEAAEEHPRLGSLDGVLLVLQASTPLNLGTDSAEQPDLQRQAFYALHEDLKAGVRLVLPACVTCCGQGAVEDQTCTVCEGTGVRLA